MLAIEIGYETIFPNQIFRDVDFHVQGSDNGGEREVQFTPRKIDA